MHVGEVAATMPPGGRSSGWGTIVITRMVRLRGYLLCCTSIVSCGPEVVDRDSIELAFTRSSETNDTERVLGVAAGGRVVELFAGASGDLLHSLQWSSDGESFAFTRSRGRSRDVVALSLASGETLLVPGILVRWMPAGLQVICRRDNHDLVLVDLATGSERVLDMPDGSGLVSAPDNDRWAYVSEDAIHIVDVETGASSRLAVRSASGEPLRPEDLAWSPDGERIAFAADDPDALQGSRLFTVDVDSGDVAMWPDEFSYGVQSPTWSPDGTRLGVGAWVFEVGWDVRVGRDSTDDEAVWVYVLVPDARIEEFYREWEELREHIRKRVREEVGNPEGFVYIRMLAASEVDANS
jgi:dipeptidyl aminopeptidase/acylaminoacyl peptidase